jgi:cell division protein FtsI/penicillin-binding protein 2
MALMMGGDKFYEYVRRFGFGERLGIELPGEIPGLVHPPTRWDKLTITRMPMGHSIAVTPLQITMGMAVIANGGHLMAPRIVQSVEKENGEVVLKKEPTVMREVVPEKTAHYVSQALIGVTEPGGTAAFARVNGFQVAGKTGTAHKVEGKGYASKKYRGFFVGIAPIDNPRIVVAVMVDEPSKGVYYGGDVAAPVFSEVVQQTLRMMGVPTDIEVKPQIVFQPGAAEVESF